MIGGLVVRAAGLAFTLIQISLIARLLLPFIDPVPDVLAPYVGSLIEVTDRLMAPFLPVAERIDLSSTKLQLPALLADLVNPLLGSLSLEVIIAIVGWGITGAIAMFLLRLVFRRR